MLNVKITQGSFPAFDMQRPIPFKKHIFMYPTVQRVFISAFVAGWAAEEAYYMPLCFTVEMFGFNRS